MTIFGIFLIYIGRFRTKFVQTDHNYGLFQDSDEESYRRVAESPPTLDRVVQFFSWQEKIKGNPLEIATAESSQITCRREESDCVPQRAVRLLAAERSQIACGSRREESDSVERSQIACSSRREE